MANSIDENLQYLSDTKEMIRQAISGKGQLMPTDLPFREYVDKINNISTGIDTSDADATTSDIADNKTAYVKGQKIQGNVFTVGSGEAWNNSRNVSSKYGSVNLIIQSDTNDSILYRSGSKIGVAVRRGEKCQELGAIVGLTSNILLEGNTVLDIDGTAIPLKGQIKEVTPTTEDQIIIPDEGFNALTQVTVKAIEEGSGDVKLFETVEEMQSDPNVQEGDLAVVYRSEVKNATVDSKFQVATFPDTVILDSAITDYVEVIYSAVDSSKMFDCMGSLDSSMFMIDCYTETGEIRIEYTSSDGITYTRTDTTGNPVDFGTEIYYEWTDMWNDAIGKFIQISGMYFDGLFEGRTVNGINIPALSSISFTVSGTSIENINFAKDNYYTLKNNDILQNLLEKIRNDIGFDKSNSDSNFLLGFDGNDKLCAYIAFNTSTNSAWTYNSYYYRSLLYDASTSEYKGIYYNDTSALNFAIGMYKFVLDLENQTYTKSVISKAQIGSTNRIYFPENFHSILVRYDIIDKYSSDPEIYVQVVSGSSFTNTDLGTNINSVNAEKENYGYDVFQYIKYFSASTQLTTVADDVYKSIFYGKNGVETGTLTENVSNSFADVNAELYNRIQNAYNDMEPRVLTDSDKTIDKNIYFIPVKKDGTVLLDTSNVTSMAGMFRNCTNLKTIPLLNTSNVTNMVTMFQSCTNLTTIPQLDTSNVTNMGAMFERCTSLTTIPLLNTSNVTNMGSMFNACTNLTIIPQLDTSTATDMNTMFNACTNLVTIPQLNTSKVTRMDYMFNGCTNLTTIPLLDTSKVTNVNRMFGSCKKLSDDSLNIILVMCTNAPNISRNKTLKYIGLTSDQANRCKTLSNYSAFTTAGWTTGY